MSKVKAQKLWTAIVTPFLDDDRVDYPAFDRLLRAQEAAGNGVILLGSTGEGLALDEQEKRELVRFALDLKLNIPLMAGIGGHQLKSCVTWMTYCQEAGIEGFLAPVPLYAKPGTKGQEEWFRAILDASRVPVMLYNVPSRTGVKMSVEALRAVASHKNAWSVKEASGSVNEFLDYRAAAPNMAFFSGDDGMTPSLAAAGAVGLVSVASNVWPEATRLFVEKSCSQETDGLFPTWKESTDALFLASNPVPTKALLAAKGIIRSPRVRPPLSAADLKDTKAVLAADERVNAWFAKARKA